MAISILATSTTLTFLLLSKRMSLIAPITTSTTTSLSNVNTHWVRRSTRKRNALHSLSSENNIPKPSTRKKKSSKKPNVSPPSTKKSTPKDNTSKQPSSEQIEAISPENPWIDLQIPPLELRASSTLTTGQAFSWTPVTTANTSIKQEAASAWGTSNAKEWIGPIGTRVFSIRETDSTTLCRLLHGPSLDLHSFFRDYFQLDTVQLTPLYPQWCQADPRLAKIQKCVYGVRILRQDPVECFISFLCSSNNNIPRIVLMLKRIRERYGSFLLEVGGLSLHSFPTLQELEDATEEELRGLGLGYRAKFIIQSLDLLRSLGGEDFLMQLRKSNDASTQLLQFPGVGRKVADCISLFSLDCHDAIPVDTHVRSIAARDYNRDLLEDAKSLTPTVYRRVGDLFRDRFGEYAGWAHSLLFVAELPSFRGVLPRDVVEEMDQWKEQEMARNAAAKKNSPSAKK